MRLSGKVLFGFALLALFLLYASKAVGETKSPVRLRRGQGVTQALAAAGCKIDWLKTSMEMSGIREAELRRLPVGKKIYFPANCQNEPGAEEQLASVRLMWLDTGITLRERSKKLSAAIQGRMRDKIFELNNRMTSLENQISGTTKPLVSADSGPKDQVLQWKGIQYIKTPEGVWVNKQFVVSSLIVIALVCIFGSVLVYGTIQKRTYLLADRKIKVGGKKIVLTAAAAVRESASADAKFVIKYYCPVQTCDGQYTLQEMPEHIKKEHSSWLSDGDQPKGKDGSLGLGNAA